MALVFNYWCVTATLQNGLTFHKASDPLLIKRESGGGHMQAVRVATFSA